LEISRLFADSVTPMVVRPDKKSGTGQNALCEWVSDNRSRIDEYIHQAGVLLVRGFDIADAAAFRAVAASVRPALRNYIGGDSPRKDVTEKVYTSTEYPAHLDVLLHNELSYAGWFPQRVFFGCIVAALSGGETQVADGRVLYQSIKPSIKNRFEHKGITYLQHLWDEHGTPGAGKSWQQTFESDHKAEVEQYLIKSNIKYQWTELGLRTSATKPAVRTHPETGEKCWHNQANQWHRDLTSVKDSVSGFSQGPTEVDTCAGEESLGNHVIYGDGSQIDPADLEHISEVSKQHEILFPWCQGDVMIIDNILMMHGRKPFSGPREIVVAMA